MSKEIELTFSERRVASKIFNEFQGGSLTQTAQLQQDALPMIISNEELKSAPEFKEEDMPGGGKQYTWNDEGTLKKFTLSDAGVEYLKGKLESGTSFTYEDVKAGQSLTEKLK